MHQKVDTVQFDNYYLTDRIVRSGEQVETKKLKGVATYVDDAKLYIANKEGGSIDVFDIETMNYIRRISHNNRTDARDVYVNGNHLFVAAGDSREVQIFDKHTGNYLTRLGTGAWTGNVSFAGCVAASERFVFVRDSKERNIRVFDRNTISLTATDNNNPFAKLDTESYYVDQKNDSHEMEIIGDSLYVFLHRQGIIYSYNLQEIETKKNSTPFAKTILQNGEKIYSISHDKETKKVYIATVRDGHNVIECLSEASFINRDFSNYIYRLESPLQGIFDGQLMIAFFNQKIMFPAANHLEQWKIKNDPIYILTPKNK